MVGETLKFGAFKTLIGAAALSAAAMLPTGAMAQTVIDLTHPIPTFQPMEGDPMKPDMSKPHEDIGLHPTFGGHAVFALGTFPTNQGHFDLGTLVDRKSVV